MGSGRLEGKVALITGVAASVAAAAKRFGGLDVLVANAGV